MNTYFDRRFAVDSKWQFHPLATAIAGSSLAADYRKTFGTLTVQAEVQFGNMARWYSDIFKFQAAYSEKLIQVGLSVVPVGAMARMTDSNVVNYERAVRELPSATLSITLPILLIGLEKDESTLEIDVTKCKFKSFKNIVGKGKNENRWRIIHGQISGVDMAMIGPKSETGPMLIDEETDDALEGGDT
jgi:hypothetical protein